MNADQTVKARLVRECSGRKEYTSEEPCFSKARYLQE
jgi:hypothetical protein